MLIETERAPFLSTSYECVEIDIYCICVCSLLGFHMPMGPFLLSLIDKEQIHLLPGMGVRCEKIESDWLSIKFHITLPSYLVTNFLNLGLMTLIGRSTGPWVIFLFFASSSRRVHSLPKRGGRLGCA